MTDTTETNIAIKNTIATIATAVTNLNALVSDESWKHMDSEHRGDLLRALQKAATLAEKVKTMVRNSLVSGDKVDGYRLDKPTVKVTVTDWKSMFAFIEKKYPVAHNVLETALTCSYAKVADYVSKYVKADPADAKATLQAQLTEYINVSENAPAVKTVTTTSHGKKA